MKRVLIYGGTTEGRRLAEKLAEAGIPSLVLVATEYGEQMMVPGEKSGRIQVRQGRLTAAEMAALYERERPAVIVDATHPYAEAVKKNIRESRAGFRQIPYYRVCRNPEVPEEREEARYFDSTEDCVRALRSAAGNILLTTGSKTLSEFCRWADLRERLYVRVLPSIESLEICRAQGIRGDRIIAMQGPFSEEMNRQMLQETHSAILVMKESGRTGGEAARMKAAAKAGAECYIIRRPNAAEEGLSLDAVFSEIRERFRPGDGASEEGGADTCRGNSGKTRLKVMLMGIGMNGNRHLTAEARQALKEARVLFGAPRMLEPFEGDYKKYPYYTGKRILPLLSEFQETFREDTVCVGILFSGDTGFYSGCRNLVPELKKLEGVEVQVLPGISSVSALAAALGVCWQDGKILSTHGIPEADWVPEFLDATAHGEKTFLITSGAKDVRRMGHLLTERHRGNCICHIGCNLGMEQEQILRLTPEACVNFEEPGLCTVLVENPEPKPRRLTPGMEDDAFTREKVPMTKEEVRALSICKLHLTAPAVVYDIGSGSGSVSVEMAGLDPSVKVFSIEGKEDAYRLTCRNVEKFGFANVTAVRGTAPECLENLPDPTHVFIGGSGGHLEEILVHLMNRKRTIRVVLNTVTLETLAEASRLMEKYELEGEICQVQVSRSRKAGAYHLMQGQNPVNIISFDLLPEEK